jgi:signal transduction histidine kinase
MDFRTQTKMGDGKPSKIMRNRVFSFLSGWERPRRWLVGLVACLPFAMAPTVWGQTVDRLPLSTRVLTNITEIWSVPLDHRNEEYRIRTEAVIYYIDTNWDNVWGECLGNYTWMPLSESPTPLKAGQRVAIDGVIVPQRQKFVWDKTRIHILEENAGLKGEPESDPGKKAQELKGHLISVEGLIDKMVDDPTHDIINFLSGSVMAYAYVLKRTNSLPFPFKEGDYVRMKCVYSPRFDRDGNLSILELWVNSPADIEVIGSLKIDARFNLPITLSDKILADQSTDITVRVEGVVRNYEPGKWVTLWDATGQVMVQSKQGQMLRFGDRVEAIGHPDLKGVEPCVLDGLYRLVATNKPTASALMTGTNALPLRLTEQIRDLSPEEADRRLPVRLRAIVTWSQTNFPFVYVLDASGGIRVVNPKLDVPDAAQPGMVVLVEGVTSAGGFVPVVTNAVLRRTGWWKVEDRRLVTLEQALTGVEEGNWVEMRGFVRDVIHTNALTRFDLSTSSGEFQAWTPVWHPFDSLKGSIIRLRGVCSAVANARHQLTGIQIWTPDGQSIEIEESAPYDVFTIPLRPLASLRRFGSERALNQRIRTSGIVVLHVPGQYLYVQDGVDSVFALSQQPDALQPGDRVEVVGFPGKEGQKFVLREAVYRRLAGGSEPNPAPLSAANFGNVNLEGLLAKTEGVLLNKMEKDGETHLLIQTKDFTSEASLNCAAGKTEKKLQALALGSRLALTGVYEAQSDESGRPHSFLLRLRSWNDVQLLQPPPWWTLARLLWVLAGVFAVFLIALTWGILIARKNALLNQAQAELQTANDQLEIRVTERTRELQNEVAAKEQAHIELAQTQQSLMLASRRAGMAEVAAGVLHNVGNVLNSVNVSANLLRDQARKSETHSLLKAAELLKQRSGDLEAFLTSDPRGKLMPEFIIQIAGQLQKEREKNSQELEQLAKNIDHIKHIVALQQSYARVAGVAEKVVPAGLVEDALQINGEKLTRQGVVIVRQFEEVPVLMVDKQKALQTLINLVLNASHALEECAQNEKRLIITIAKAERNCVLIRVEDNGIGIPPENLTLIFAHGFTTRPDGHGFGLHIGALNAREMGGSLSVASEGVGRGAAFSLILPMSSPAKNS